MADPIKLNTSNELDALHAEQRSILGRRALAGLFQTIMPSSAAPEGLGYMPNSIFGLAGLANMVKQAVTGEEITGGRPMEIFEAGADDSYLVTGLPGPPNSPIGHFFEIAGGMAVPSPVKIPKIPGGSTLIGKVAAGTANAAIEGASPLNTSRTLPGGAVSVGIPFAAEEGLREGVVESIEGQGTQNTVIDAITGEATNTTQAEPDDLGFKILPPPQSETGGAEFRILPPASAAMPPVSPVDMAAADGLTEPEEDPGRSMTTSAAIGLAAVAGTSAALRIVRNRVFGGTVDEVPSDTASGIAGQKPIKQITGDASKSIAAVVDKNDPIYDAIDKAYSNDPLTRELIRAQVRTTVTPTAAVARIKHAQLTGELPNTSIKIPKLGVHLDTLATLSPQQLELYDDALIAMTKLDEINSGRIAVWRGRFPGQELRAGDLNPIVSMARSDPQVSALINEAHSIYHGFRDYLLEGGLITQADHRKWSHVNKHYVPTQPNYDDPQAIRDFLYTAQRSGDEAGLRVGETIRPSMMHEEYMLNVIRMVEDNRIRADLLERLHEHFPDVVHPAKASSKLTIDAHKNGESIHYHVSDHALREALKFQAPKIPMVFNTARRILQELSTGMLAPGFIPVSWAYEIGTAIHLNKAGTQLGPADEILSRAGLKTFGDMGIPDPTVILSPLTGASRALWAQSMNAINHNVEMQLRNSSGILGKLPQPMLRRIADTTSRAYERSAFAQMNRYGGGNAVLLDGAEMEDVGSLMSETAPRLAAARANTRIKEAASRIGKQGLTHADVWNNTRVISASIADKARANNLVRGYRAFVSAMHNGVRVQHFASNLAGEARATNLTRQNRENLATLRAARTRQLTGDTTQTGNNQFLQDSAFKSIPYANTATQIYAQHARAIKANPKRYFTTLAAMNTAGMGLLLSQMDNDNARDYYWNQMTPEQRSSKLPIFGDDGKPIVEIPIYHEMRMLWAPLVESVGTTLGYKSGNPLLDGMIDSATSMDLRSLQAQVEQAFGRTWTDQDRQDVKSGLARAVSDLTVDPVNPVVGAGMGALGINPDLNLSGKLMGEESSSGRFGAGKPLSTERLTFDRDSRIPNSVIGTEAETIVHELMGSASRPFLDSIHAFVNEIDSTNDFYRATDAALKNFGAGKAERSPVHAIGRDLFDLDAKLSAQDANAKLVRKARVGIDLADALFRNYGGSEPGVQSIALTPEEQFIVTNAGKLKSILSTRFKPMERRLYQERDVLRANPAFSGNPALRRTAENEIYERIRRVHRLSYQIIAEFEDRISHHLGREFRFEDFRTDKLQAPPR